MHAVLERLGRPRRQAQVAAALAAALGLVAGARAARAGEDETLVVNFAGDVSWPDGWGGIGEIDDKQSALFAAVQPILATGDLNFANLECPFTTARAVLVKTYPITCAPKRLLYAVGAGFNLFSLANNHALDAGAAGIHDTLALLAATTSAERPLWWAGIGESADQVLGPLAVAPPGKRTRVAFFAVANTSPQSPVASVHDPALPERIAAAARDADVVIVSVHYGPEYIHVPSAETVALYHSLIDAGADVVAAHHAHVVQGVERYQGGVIFYSLGNFSFGSHTRRHLETGARMYSMIGRVTFRAGRVSRAEIVPLYANNSYRWTLGGETLEPRHAVPQLLAGAFAAAAMDELEAFAAAVPGGAATALVRVGDRLFVDLGDGAPGAAAQAVLIHEQHHEYAAAEALGAVPRPATEGERQVANRGGTPVSAAPPAPAPRTPAKNRRAARPGAARSGSARSSRRK